ncbi:magnesium-chelatase 60 kDa subunit [Methanobrevibacter cuticularis]|uniref:Magnesium-chelatase 60 kDa subunit n=1 Tax=Methanobrevibacter cuticularis TaxID=47311 RepID=A0A166DW95_9EURY|nr:VWA domain-containing protein [Methanobrevibacter cuticularis]KZX16019.1 magnesium-chelatase 60 kDa subunit [Methanobrevibacter cuticularis]
MDNTKDRKLYGKQVKSQNKTGKYVKSKFLNSNLEEIAIDATLRAAALRSGESINNISNLEKKQNIPVLERTQDNLTIKTNSNLENNDIIKIKNEDLREKIRKHGVRAAITLVIDMSGSMISEDKLIRIKSILKKIITNVQLNKDKLTVIGFKGRDSEVIIPNTKRPASFLNNLKNITVGGTTPMAAGLDKALEITKQEAKKGEYLPIMMILSDGVTNVGLDKSNIRRKNKNKSTKYNINRTSFKKTNSNKNKNPKSSITMNNNQINNPMSDVLAIGEKIAENEIHTIIINFEKEKGKGRSVNKELCFITSGRLYDLGSIYDSFNNNHLDNEKLENNSNPSSKSKSLVFDSFKNDISDLAIDEILNFERKNI